MSKIAEALLAPPKPCVFAKIFASLDDEDREAIAEAIAEEVSSNAIALAIRTGGYKMGHQTVSDHRNSICKCEPTGRRTR